MLPPQTRKFLMSNTATPGQPRTYKYYDLIMVAAVVVLVCSNLIGPAKKAQVDLPFFGPVGFGAGVLFFPISYIFGDILTEVYGYSRERRVIWAGFAALAFAAVMAAVVVALPPAPGWTKQEVYQQAFGNTWRINGASIIAFLCGSFVNSLVMAKMKIMTNGRHLWSRIIGSTICGEFVDSILFYPLAFYGAGMIPNELLPSLVQSQFIAKTLVEVIMTPVTYAVVNFLKRAEGEDFYDRDTNFTPFKL
jgi:queuosine precursor transporter